MVEPNSDNGDFITSVVDSYVTKFPWADAEAVELQFRMNATVGAMRAASQRLFASLGHDDAYATFGVLRALYFAPEKRLSQTMISRRMVSLRSSNLTYLIDGLEKSGQVTRVQDPKDRRVWLVELTSAGEQLCQILAPELTRMFEWFAKSLTRDEKRDLIRLVKKFCRRVEEFEALHSE